MTGQSKLRASRDQTSEVFKLDRDFVESFKDKPEPFGFSGLGHLVYLRTYSRIREEDGKKERWYQTVERVVNGTYNMQKTWIEWNQLGWKHKKAQKSAQEMYCRIFELKFSPPGRGLWAMGSPITEKKGLYASLNNCAFISTDTIEKDGVKAFCFLMDASMLGIGVGFDTKGAGKIVVKGADLDAALIPHVIPDSREGWVESTQLLLEAYFYGTADYAFDYSKIRPAGVPIKNFGGVSSGPGVLKDLHERLREACTKNAGSEISITTIVDIMNHIGVCVVSGNVRRCLPKGTLVHTNEGLIPIESIAPGMLARTSSGFHPILELVEQGVQEVVTIDTQLGPVQCTERHRIAVMTKPGHYEWKRAYELVSGDRMVFVEPSLEATAAAENETFLPEWTYERPSQHSTTCVDISIPRVFDEGQAWLFGAFHGNGYCYPNFENDGRGGYVSIAVNGDNAQMKDRCVLEFERYGVNVTVSGPKEGDHCFRVRCASKQLAWYLSQFKKSSEPISVPEMVLRGSAAVRAAYLAGEFDADGSNDRPLIAACSIYPEFLKQLQAVYASLGIPTRFKKRREAQGEWKALYVLSVVGERARDAFSQKIAPHSTRYKETRKTTRSQNDYGFPSAWVQHMPCKSTDKTYTWSKKNKQLTVQGYERLGGTDLNGLVPIEVYEVRRDGTRTETYDIAVQDAHEFVFGPGVLGHNTAEISFGDPDSEEYIDLKNYEKNPHRGAYGWTSNNSVFAKLGMDYSNVAQRTAMNGEPGYAWLDNMRNFGRMNGIPDDRDRNAMGGNPCVTGDTMVMTSDGPRRADSLLHEPCEIIVDGKAYRCETGFFETGTKDVYRLRLDSGQEIVLTEDHKVLTASTLTEGSMKTVWKKAGDLTCEDSVVLNNLRNMKPWHGTGGSLDEGWIIGAFLGDGHHVSSSDRYKLEFWGSSKEVLQQLAIDRIGELNESNEAYDSRRTRYSVESRDMCGVSCNAIGMLLEKNAIDGKDKSFADPLVLLSRSAEFQIGFIRGLFDTDGSPQGNTNKGISARLSSTRMAHLRVVQQMLSNLGIQSKIHENRQPARVTALPDGRGSSKEYQCKAVHELIISKDNLQVFMEVVGFDNPEKQRTLNELLGSMKRKMNRERFISKVASFELDGTEPVYDCTVDQVHRFAANGIIVHNCLEQTLEPFEMCCVSGDTRIMTRNGAPSIASVVGKEVEVFNGENWSTVTPFLAARNKPLYRVTLSDGSHLDVTDTHEWSARRRTACTFKKLPTSDLEIGMILESFATNSKICEEGEDFPGAYQVGWFAGDGYIARSGDHEYAMCTVNRLDYTILKHLDGNDFRKEQRLNARDIPFIPVDMSKHVPIELAKRLCDPSAGLPDEIFSWSSESIAEFIGGCIDIDGCLCENLNTDNYILYGSERKLRDVQMLARRIGVNHATLRFKLSSNSARPYDLWCLTIPSYEAAAVKTRIKVARRFGERYAANNVHSSGGAIDRARRQKIVSIVPLDGVHDTFCFTEPEKHMGVFGNCLTYQCLVETFPHRHESKEDFLRTLKFAYLYAKTVTLGRTHWEETNRVMLRNRRIGCSLSGVAQFITQRGIEELRVWCQQGYDTIQRYDEIYSRWMVIPRSIKTTSIKVRLFSCLHYSAVCVCVRTRLRDAGV